LNNMVKKMKIKRISFLVVFLFVFGAIVFCSPALQHDGDETGIPTPNWFVAEPVFSAQSGFYDEPFYLELSAAPNTKIYYTLDCSDPDENAIEYNGSILIENVSENENVYSMLTNVSAGFYSDLIEKYHTIDVDPIYMAPDYPVKKCMVVRAVAVDKYGNRSKVVSNSFFVEEDLDFYQGCNIVSIVTAPENLFDDGTGIYVTGDIFEDYLLKKKPSAYWRFWEANYRQKGQKWEREVDFTFFNEEGELILSSNGGIRVQGGVSRGALPRNLNLYADHTYAEGSMMNDRLFSQDFVPTKVTFSAGGNRTITLFNDRMMSDRTASLHFSKMTFKPYVLFLEGEYWGFYWLTNAYNERYISYHYGIDEDDVVLIKNGALETETSNDILLYDNMKRYITETDLSVPGNYEHACELLDMDSFLDYYACLAYIARQEDWPISNYALWRSRSVGDGAYADGKWRWMLFDCNSASMRIKNLDHDTLSYIIDQDAIFASFWKNADFRAAFEQRILEIADECFDPQEMSDYIDDYIETMPKILEHSWARFYGSKNDKATVFYDLMEDHRTFFSNRKAVVKTWFDSN